MSEDYPFLRWLVIIAVAAFVLVQCGDAMDSPTGPHYGPDCIVVYYSNGPMCE